MLTETAAFALLELYCTPLRHSKWAHVDFHRNNSWEDAALEHVDFVVRPPDDATTTAHARRLGARLRLALGVAQAVSYCRGFEPEINRPFWYHVLATLWFIRNYMPPDTLTLSRQTFSHVGVEWRLASAADDTFWVGFFHGTPGCDAVLSTVLAKLVPHFATALPLPPLHVSLCGGYTAYQTPHVTYIHVSYPNLSEPFQPRELPRAVEGRMTDFHPHAVRSIVRAALRAPVQTTWSSSLSASTHVGLVIEFRVGDSSKNMRKTLLLLRQLPSPHAHLMLTIERLMLQLAPRKPPRTADPSGASSRALVTRGRVLGELLRTLLIGHRGEGGGGGGCRVNVHTVALMGCGYSDHRHVGAALSAVAHALTPSSVAELRCRGLFDASARDSHLLRLAWLVYALQKRRQRCQPSSSLASSPLSLSLLSAGVTINAYEGDYIQLLLARGTPLRDVVGDALRLRLDGDDDQVARLTRVDCLRLGSTARLARGTRLFFEPFRDDDACVAAVTLEDEDDREETEKLDLVAHVADFGGWVGVVYPGFGLVWAVAASVVAWHRLEEDDDVDMTTADEVTNDDPSNGVNAASLSSIALRFEGAEGVMVLEKEPEALRVTALLPLLASATLTTLTIDRAVLLRADLALILACFPRLEALRLDRCVVETLEPLVVGATQDSSLVMLSLLGVRDLRFRKRWVRFCPALYGGLTSHPKDGDAPVWLAPFVHTLVRNGGSVGHHGRRLRELWLDVGAVGSEDDERALLTLVACAVERGSLPLPRLHVTSRWNLDDTVRTLFDPLRDVVLRDPPRVRCAVLSVLRAFCRGVVVREIARTVLTLVEGSVVRTITWDGRGNI